MTNGVVGRKCGMTQIFTPEGLAVPVTVIHVATNRVVQIKQEATDGYNAVQVTSGEKKLSRVNRPITGHYAKASNSLHLHLKR
jgi:large subunit ribosomal protein L3